MADLANTYYGAVARSNYYGYPVPGAMSLASIRDCAAPQGLSANDLAALSAYFQDWVAPPPEEPPPEGGA